MKFDAVGFGALNVDKLYSVYRIAVGGESLVTGYVEAAGGSAGNAIVGLARLKDKVGYIGKVGSDDEGEFILSSLMSESVDTKGIIISRKSRSGIAIGFVDKTGERMLFIDPGANDMLSLDEIDGRYVENTEFLHLTSFVGNKPFEAQKSLIQNLSNVKVSFDPGELYARKGLTALRPILKRSFVVFPNEREMKLLVGKDYKEGARVLIEEGVSVVAVKLGKNGCYVSNGKEEFLIDAFKVSAVDTTGAGDAFCAGFLHGLLSRKDIYVCGKLGNFVASRKIVKPGGREGLPKLSDLPKVW